MPSKHNRQTLNFYKYRLIPLNDFGQPKCGKAKRVTVAIIVMDKFNSVNFPTVTWNVITSISL